MFADMHFYCSTCFMVATVTSFTFTFTFVSDSDMNSGLSKLMIYSQRNKNNKQSERAWKRIKIQWFRIHNIGKFTTLLGNWRIVLVETMMLEPNVSSFKIVSQTVCNEKSGSHLFSLYMKKWTRHICWNIQRKGKRHQRSTWSISGQNDVLLNWYQVRNINKKMLKIFALGRKMCVSFIFISAKSGFNSRCRPRKTLRYSQN